MTLYRQTQRNILAIVISCSALAAQNGITAKQAPTLAEKSAPDSSDGYVLGPDDQITILALHADEISGKPLQVDGTGSISLPMVGRLKVGGLTVPQVEDAVAASLKAFIEKPLVTVTVTEYQSQPVSVLGAVTTPGQYQIKGRRTILDVLSMAGGLRPDSGHTLRITRRLENGRLPLANVVGAPSGQFTVAELKLKDLMESVNPNDNLVVKPHDVITVPKAELVYVLGEVNKSGGFVLNDQESLSVVQALAMAGGITKTASTHRARILCAAEGQIGNRKEIEIDLSKMLEGKAPDVAIHAQDILFVPTNTPKNVALRALEIAIQTGSGVVIWRSARY